MSILSRTAIVIFILVFTVTSASAIYNEDYFKIQNGMTYDEVVAIFGGEGAYEKQKTRYKDKENSQLKRVVFRWGPVDRRNENGKILKGRYGQIYFNQLSGTDIKSGRVYKKDCRCLVDNPECRC